MSRRSDAQWTRNFHHHHASGTSGIDTRRSVFHRQAFYGRHAQSTRRFEVNVGRWFANRYVISRDDFIEPIGNAHDLQCFLNDKTRTTRGNAHRHLAAPLAGKVSHFLDQLDTIQLAQKRLTFRKRHTCWIELQTVFGIQIDHDVLGRTSAHGIKDIFRQNIGRTILGEGLAPCIKVSRHRINQCAVTIENDRRKR